MSETIKEGYKLTEVGVIPEDWGVDKIVNLAFITTGAKNTQDKIDDGHFPFFVRSQTIERINSYSFYGEAVLTAGDGVGTGKVFHYINGKFDFHQRVYKISDFKEELNGYFFFLYFSNNFYNRIMQMTAKSSVDSVRREMIADMKIPLPPLPEQRAIAEALSDVDSLITSLEELITKKRNIKQGAMQELLTGKKRLVAEQKKGYKQTDVGEIPDDWDVKSLSEITEVIMGQSPVGSSYNQSEIGIALINGPTEFTKKYPIKIQWTSSPTKLCKKDDLLLCVRGSSTGRINISNNNYCIGRGVAAIRAKDNCNNSFLEFQVHSAVRNILSLTAGSTFPNIDGKTLKNIKVAFPPLEEQKAIAETLSDMDAEIETLEEKRHKYKAIKQGMMQELLTGKTRLI